MYNLEGKVLVGRYRLESFMDEGGMSVIYKAFDLIKKQHVAIKVLKQELAKNKEFSDRFLHEAMASGQVNHKNIVKLYDVGNEDNIRFLILELVEGFTLKELIQQRVYLEEDVSINIALQILSALSHAHSKNIIHRDIKPQNILIDQHNVVKVSDFGIARIANIKTLTKKDMAVGTVQYVSPEQAQGLNLSKASDIYSLGVVMFEMLTGSLPFDGEDPLSIAMQQINEKPPQAISINPSISKEISLVVDICLQKDPKNRYSNCEEILGDLMRIVQGEAPHFAIAKLEYIKEQEKLKLIEDQSKQVQEVAKPEPIVRHRHSNAKYLAFFGVPLFLLLLVISIYFGFSLLNGSSKNIYAPNLVNTSVEEAVSLLKSLGLKSKIQYVYNDSVSENYIISQSPSPQSSLDADDTILLNISRGKEKVVLPDLTGLSLNDVRDIAVANGFTISVVEYVVSSTIPKGDVVDQYPKSGEKIDRNTIVQLFLSGGSREVPSLLRLNIEQARAILLENQLELGNIEYINGNEQNNASIASQSISPGNKVIEGLKINIRVYRATGEYVQSIIFKLPKMKTAYFIKAVLIVENKEYVQLDTLHDPNEENEELKLDLKANISGTHRCNLYINDALIDSVEVVFK